MISAHTAIDSQRAFAIFINRIFRVSLVFSFNGACNAVCINIFFALFTDG